MKNKLLIIGASGHGKVIADVALKMKTWENIFFLDDENNNASMEIKVIGNLIDAPKYIKDFTFFVGIGNNTTRKIIQEKLEAEGASLATLIHPAAIIGEQVSLAKGTVVMAGVVINSCTSIGKGCIINTGATVDHDNLIGDYVHISPGAHLAGSVKIGQGSWVGIGSVVSNNIHITCNCMIGAGAVVVKNINESGTYVGIPARRVNNGNDSNII